MSPRFAREPGHESADPVPEAITALVASATVRTFIMKGDRLAHGIRRAWERLGRCVTLADIRSAKVRAEADVARCEHPRVDRHLSLLPMQLQTEASRQRCSQHRTCFVTEHDGRSILAALATMS